MSDLKSPLVAGFEKLVSQAPENCTKAFTQALQDYAPQLVDAIARGEKIVSCDDGSFVTLDSYAGGAAKTGLWSVLTLRFHAPDGSTSTKTYKEVVESDDKPV